MAYDFDRYSEIVEVLLGSAWRDSENPTIGEDVSDFPEIKVMFNKYGFNEDTQQDDNAGIEEYCIFIHLNSGVKGFNFPEHQLSPFGIIHRPNEEVCARAWFIKNQDRSDQEIEDGENEGEWEIEDLENTSQDIDLDDMMDVLENFAKNYSI